MCVGYYPQRYKEMLSVRLICMFLIKVFFIIRANYLCVRFPLGLFQQWFQGVVYVGGSAVCIIEQRLRLSLCRSDSSFDKLG